VSIGLLGYCFPAFGDRLYCTYFQHVFVTRVTFLCMPLFFVCRSVVESVWMMRWEEFRSVSPSFCRKSTREKK